MLLLTSRILAHYAAAYSGRMSESLCARMALELSHWRDGWAVVGHCKYHRDDLGECFSIFQLLFRIDVTVIPPFLVGVGMHML
jgi:hypothetical protein